MPLRAVHILVRSQAAGYKRRSIDRISLASLPLLLEGADVKVADRFAALVEDAKSPRELLSNGAYEDESEHARNIVKITFVCEFHGPTD